MIEVKLAVHPLIESLVREYASSELTTVLLLAIFVLLIYNGSAHFSRRRRKSGRRSRFGAKGSRPAEVFRLNDRSDKRNTSPFNDMSDPAKQIEAVSKVNFEKCNLLNKSEARLLPALEGLVREVGKGQRVMAQTSLGEIIRPVSKDKGDWARANASINSKRLDFAIFNRYGILVAAIEYQGSGHHHQKTFMRDAVKREALRRAGVPMIEVQQNGSEETLRSQLLPLLNGNGA